MILLTEVRLKLLKDELGTGKLHRRSLKLWHRREVNESRGMLVSQPHCREPRTSLTTESGMSLASASPCVSKLGDSVLRSC